MNFYFDASNILDRLDAKQGSIKGLIATLPEKARKRTAALVIETLKCELGLIYHTAGWYSGTKSMCRQTCSK